KELFVNIANGELENHDSVIISSSRLLRYITKGELGKIFGNVGRGDLGPALSSLQDFIMTEILGKSAVVGVYVEEEKEPAPLTAGGVFEEQASGKFFSFLKNLTDRLPKISAFSFSGKFSWPNSIKEKLLGILPESVSPKSLAQKLPEIRLHRTMSRERILILVVLLCVLLIGGVFWLKTRGDQARAIAEQQVKLNAAQELINEAATNGQFDKTKASELLTSAEQKILEVLNSKYLRGEAVKMLDSLQQSRDGLDDIKRVKSPTILADFSEKRTTVSALGLLSLKDHLYGFEYNALYEIVLDKLQDPMTINDIETVILGTDYPDGDSLLFLTRTGKMVEYIAANFAFVPTKDGVWKKGVDMKSYNEKVYILDPERNQIWRYARRREGFDVGEQYNQNADLSKSVSLSIDSSIYVLNSDGTVIQMYQGQKQDYPLRRAPLSALTSPTKIYTNANLNYLYILEPSKQRVLVLRKDPKNGGAQYQTQYIFEKTGVLRDLAVFDNRLYVMDDKKVYFVNLSGL
ncbi:hypothetical protein HZC21_03660, partial [Candidatus Peregrinibacteria bacterium]|nr:hypothetical protein [Candidatus Peregrinibacteria bacterium]